MMRYLGHLSARTSTNGRTRDEGILVGIAACYFPQRRDRSIHTDLITIGPLTACLYDPGWISRIRCTGVRAIQPVEGGCQRQLSVDVPLDAHFVVAEFLRLNLLSNRRQGRKLVTRTWQMR